MPVGGPRLRPRTIVLAIAWLVIFFISSLTFNASAENATAPLARFPSSPSQSSLLSATEQAFSTLQMKADGDLWPSCWSGDGNLYAASGDGRGFNASNPRDDLVVSRISGMPPQLVGKTLATDVGTNWSGAGFNRKPTGMLCTRSAIYLAFQNLDSVHFNSAPAASIAKSTDHGLTWTWDKQLPMFGGTGEPPLFTTIFFLDYGQNSDEATGKYVYAYGLDNNWRAQQALYLARVAPDRVQTRSDWEFYAAASPNGPPRWSKNITEKRPVLVDTRLLHPEISGDGCPASEAVIAQGGVVYDKPLKRYLFSSWSCSTHELYAATSPWGPWKHLMSSDFESSSSRHGRGQYGTSIPSKFISRNGLSMFLQSNVCCGGDSYTFSLRQLHLAYLQQTKPARTAGDIFSPELRTHRAVVPALSLKLAGAGLELLSFSKIFLARFSRLCRYS